VTQGTPRSNCLPMPTRGKRLPCGAAARIGESPRGDHDLRPTVYGLSSAARCSHLTIRSARWPDVTAVLEIDGSREPTVVHNRDGRREPPSSRREGHGSRDGSPDTAHPRPACPVPSARLVVRADGTAAPARRGASAIAGTPARIRVLIVVCTRARYCRTATRPPLPCTSRPAWASAGWRRG
jgi:hypothetical protein